MAELVEEDHHDDGGDHDEPADPAEHAEGDDAGQQQGELPVEADDLALGLGALGSGLEGASSGLTLVSVTG